MVQFLRKDLMLVARPFHILFALPIAALFGLVFHWIYYGSMLVTLFFLFTILFYDVKYQADSFMCSLPVRRRDMVLARYIVALCFSVTGLLLTLVFVVPYSFVTGSISISGMELYMILGMDLLIFAVFYPFYYQFGGLITYVAYFLFIALLVGYAVGHNVAHFDAPLIKNLPGAVILACSFLLYVLSYFVSIRIFARKDI